MSGTECGICISSCHCLFIFFVTRNSRKDLFCWLFAFKKILLKSDFIRFFFGSGYSAGPGQIVPRGYSTGPGQIVPRLFSRTRLNSYNALIGYLTGPKMFMLKYLRNFYSVFLYLITCIAFKSVYIHFFLFVHVWFFFFLCAVLENMVRKGLYDHV